MFVFSFCDRHGPQAQVNKPSVPSDLMCAAEAIMPRLILRLIQHLRENRSVVLVWIPLSASLTTYLDPWRVEQFNSYKYQSVFIVIIMFEPGESFINNVVTQWNQSGNYYVTTDLFYLYESKRADYKSISFHLFQCHSWCLQAWICSNRWLVNLQ